jgi:Ca2+-binding EF-hand superfamily protein
VQHEVVRVLRDEVHASLNAFFSQSVDLGSNTDLRGTADEEMAAPVFPDEPRPISAGSYSRSRRRSIITRPATPIRPTGREIPPRDAQKVSFLPAEDAKASDKERPMGTGKHKAGETRVVTKGEQREVSKEPGESTATVESGTDPAELTAGPVKLIERRRVSLQEARWIQGFSWSNPSSWKTAFTSAPASQQELAEKQQKAARRKGMNTFGRVVTSDAFDQFMGLILVFNAGVMGAQVNWQAANLGNKSPDTYAHLDTFFCLAFVIELVCRWAVYGFAFYTMDGWQWSWFDSLIVGLQVFEELLLVAKGMSDGGSEGDGGVGIDVGVLKLLKIARLLRMVRMVRLIPELKAMVYLIMASMKSFFWTCILMLVLIYMIAVYMTMMATECLKDNTRGEANAEDYDSVTKQWGSLSSSVMSLFHSISGGADWAELIGPLVNETNNQIHNIAFTMFIAFSTMVLMNLVTGVFVEGAQRLSKEDRDKELVKLAYKTFGIVDEDDSAVITWEELSLSMENRVLEEYLVAMDLSRTNAQDLFRLLDEDQSGEISIEEFVHGCMRLKGIARAADVCQILVDVQELRKELMEVAEEVRKARQEASARDVSIKAEISATSKDRASKHVDSRVYLSEHQAHQIIGTGAVQQMLLEEVLV